jgi:surface polysaccharide O-acyltransferase-like enzyme
MSVRQSSEPGVNAFRFVLMFTVVLSHAWWLFGPPIRSGDPSYLLLITAQCSVPAFFITSGYFLHWREGDPLAVTRWAMRKLLPLYAIWMAIYIVVTWFAGFGVVYSVSAWLDSREGFLDLVRHVGFGASTRHLWFLLALAFALSATSLSLRLLGERRTWMLAGAVAAVGLLTGPYQMFLGLDGHAIRAQFLTAPLLVLLGVHIATSRIPRRPLLVGLAVIVAYWLQVLDDRWLATAPGYATTKARTAVTLATFPFAISAFLFARSLAPTTSLEWLSRRKHYLLIIYCIHPMILIGLNSVWDQRGLAPMLLATTFAFTLSVLAAVGVAIAHRRWRELARARGRLSVELPPEASAAVTRG